MKSHSESYKAAGVDITAGYEAVERMKRHVARTNIPGVLSGLGGFGALFAPDVAGMREPVLVSGTDGVGTKLKLAFLLDKHDTVGIDCVAMCVNDIVCSGARPLFFLDYIALGKSVPARVEAIVAGVAEGCVQAGCALVGGETAEMPGFYPQDEYDLAGFAVGLVDRANLLDGRNVRAGDAILALPSSGPHSNGFSLIRKVHADRLREHGEALLAPTRIYVKPILELLRGGAPVHAIAHITGGGITENLNRALADDVDAVVTRNGAEMGWDVPPVITYVSRQAELAPNEACKTFNMGVGLCLIVAPEDEAAVTEALVALGEKPFRVGECVEGSGKVVYSDER